MEKIPVVPKKYILPFILVTSLFALWGFANDITNPLVAVFKDVFVINNAQSSWVQMAFYGGYGTMAIPAALFIRKFSYKSGIVLGLSLYALGAMLSIPAANGANFNLFIVALYVLTFGLAFLETTANPYILSMGDARTSTRRLNLAQAFNPIGSLSGMFIAGTVILSTIEVEDFKNDVAGSYAEAHPAKEDVAELNVLPFLKAEPRERKYDPEVAAYIDQVSLDQEEAGKVLAEAKASLAKLDKDNSTLVLASVQQSVESVIASNEDVSVTDIALKDYKEGVIPSYQGKTHAEMQKADLKIVSTPYMVIGFVVIGVMVLFLLTKMPHTSLDADDDDKELDIKSTLGRLFSNPRYLGGVVAQTFYVGAQIMCWTFIIQYAENELGMDKATAQNHNIMAMVIFLCNRFICTFFLSYISAGKLLGILAMGAIAATLGAIHLDGMAGLYSLVAISACMSLMFPTIYGLALEGIGSDAKIGSAGLILAIVGGAFMPRLQAGIIDMDSFMGVSSTRGSFYLPVLCFIVIAIYGFFAGKRKASA